MSGTENLTQRTFGDVVGLMENPDPNLPQKAIERFVSQAGSHLEKTYAQMDGEGTKIFYVRPANTPDETRDEIYELERVLHVSYPSLRLAFQAVSRGDLTPEQIQRSREKWIPSGQLVYPPPNKKTD